MPHISNKQLTIERKGYLIRFIHKKALIFKKKWHTTAKIPALQKLTHMNIYSEPWLCNDSVGRVLFTNPKKISYWKFSVTERFFFKCTLTSISVQGRQKNILELCSHFWCRPSTVHIAHANPNFFRGTIVIHQIFSYALGHSCYHHPKTCPIT